MCVSVRICLCLCVLRALCDDCDGVRPCPCVVCVCTENNGIHPVRVSTLHGNTRKMCVEPRVIDTILTRISIFLSHHCARIFRICSTNCVRLLSLNRLMCSSLCCSLCLSVFLVVKKVTRRERVCVCLCVLYRDCDDKSGVCAGLLLCLFVFCVCIVSADVCVCARLCVCATVVCVCARTRGGFEENLLLLLLLCVRVCVYVYVYVYVCERAHYM